LRRKLAALSAVFALALLVVGGFAARGAQAGPSTRVLVVGPGAAAASARHGTILQRLPIIGGVSAKIRAGELQALAAEPGVTRVVRDARMVQNGKTPVPTSTSVDTESGLVNYKYLTTLYPWDDNVSRNWDWGYDGRGVGIAIIDSGVAALPEFGSRLVQVQLDGRTETVNDEIGHGTFVAAIAAGYSKDGKFIGVAPRARIFGINVSRDKQIYSSDVISGLQWVLSNAHGTTNGVPNNIRVVNLSMTETTPSSYKNSLLDLAVERVWASGTMVVVAAGNTGKTLPADYAPANDPLAFTVGGMDDKATARLSDDEVASFSAGGTIGQLTTMDGFSKPEILASARLIETTAPGSILDAQAPLANRIAGTTYVKISGTSFAAPQVAGAAALLFQQNPGWSPDNVKFTLMDRARIVKAGTIVQLDVGAAINISSPGRANQGVPALVCHPGATCSNDGTSTIASIWDSSAWTSSAWTSSAWTSSAWTSSAWTSSAWTSSAWTSSAWTGTSDWSYMSWS
jgi:serine protease AprX